MVLFNLLPRSKVVYNFSEGISSKVNKLKFEFVYKISQSSMLNTTLRELPRRIIKYTYIYM